MAVSQRKQLILPMVQLILGFIIGGIFGFGICAVFSINNTNFDRAELRCSAEKSGDRNAQ